jgi:LysM repeat protein
VREGDTLVSIAARFGTSAAAIQRANGLGSADVINVGQVLVIP